MIINPSLLTSESCTANESLSMNGLGGRERGTSFPCKIILSELGSSAKAIVKNEAQSDTPQSLI